MVAAESILRTAGRSGKSAGTWCIRSIGENRWERGCCGIGSKNSKRSVLRITVRTSQLAFGFYEKRGFELKGIEKDYWAEGFDLYRMEYVRRE